MLGLIFSSNCLNWIGALYIISIAKTASKNIGALNSFYEISFSWGCSYLYKSTIHPCMEYYCHAWNGAPSCYLELLDKLQKRICRTVGPLLAASLRGDIYTQVATLNVNMDVKIWTSPPPSLTSSVATNIPSFRRKT